MADNPFANIQDEQQQPVEAPTQSPTKSITDADRVALKVLFDNQPARRAAYGKKIGIEFDPKDPDNYRPIGSPKNAPYDQTIDPGVGAYFRKGGMSEAVKDLSDLSWDTAVMGPLVTLGATEGAKAGALIAAPAQAGLIVPGAAAATGGAVGGLVGSTLGYTLSEEVKNLVGSWVLEQDYVPPDHALTVIQGVVMGMAPEMLNKGMKLTKNVIVKAFEQRTEALKNLIQVSGGVPNTEMLDYMAKNPQAFSKDAVKGGISKLQGAYRSIFGLTEKEFLERADKGYIPSGSIFSEELQKYVDQKLKQLADLDKLHGARWTVGELVEPLEKELLALNKYSHGGDAALTQEQKAAKSYLEAKIASIYEDAAGKSGIRNKPIDVSVPTYMQTEATHQAKTNYGMSPKSLRDGVTIEGGQYFKTEKNPLGGEIKTPIEANEAYQELSNATTTVTGEASKLLKGADKKISLPVDTEALKSVQMPFSYGEKVLSSMQGDAFDREVAGSRYLKEAITRQIKSNKELKNLNPERALGEIAAAKAQVNGIDLPATNARIHEIKNAYNAAAEHISPNNLGAAFTGLPGNDKYANVKQALGQIDKTLGTDLSSDVGMKGMQAWTEKQYMSGSKYGSGSVISATASEGVKGAIKGGTAAGAATLYTTGDPSVAKAAAVVGAAINGTRAALQASKLANPAAAAETLSRFATQEQAAKAFASKIPTLRPELNSAINNYNPAVAEAVTSLPAGLQAVKQVGKLDSSAANIAKAAAEKMMPTFGEVATGLGKAAISKKPDLAAPTTQYILDAMKPPEPKKINPFEHITDEE